MFRNYLFVALRNIRRHKGHAFINMFGLATGMAAFVLIVLFIRNEASFDRHVTQREDIYRVILDARIGDQEILTCSSPAVMAGAFIESFPEVESATRIGTFSEVLITVGDRPFYETGFFQADSTVFDLFSLPLLVGDAPTALNRPGTIVLAESVAQKYYGTLDVLGRTIRYDNRIDYEITGVMADPPVTAHFRPLLVASFLTNDRWNSPIWLNNSFFTYIKLRPGSDPGVLTAKFPDFLRTNVGPQIQQFTGQDYDQAVASGLRYTWQLERLSDIYLYSRAQDQLGATGDIRYLRILGIIAVFVLLIACINFMNLSTARATGRAREVGVRKVLGSDRGGLIRQFMGESVAMSLLAMVLAFGIVVAALPMFSSLAGAQLHVESWLVGAMVATALFTGIVAGLYPAIVLSGFKPAVVLKGNFSSGRRGVGLRSALVVFQFAITVVLLVGTTIVFKQLRFIQNTDLGFDVSQVVVVPIETDGFNDAFETFRSELLGNTAIVDATASGILPGPDHIHNNTVFGAEGMSQDETYLAALGEVSDDYVETLGLEMVAGRDFDPAFPSDSTAWVLNAVAAAQFGWTPEEAVGKIVTKLEGDVDRVGPVVGVMADAFFTSVHELIRPMIVGNRISGRRYAAIRIQAGRTADALPFIESKWSAFEPGYPFRYFFLDSDYQKFYEREERLGSLYLYFTILAILIACLGLFGLASFVTAQRTREIGVRKAIGASVSGIVVLLTKEFTFLVLIACAIAFPIAGYAMSQWLSNFAYATSIGWLPFVLSGISALVIAWLTVSVQSVRAAMTDPVKALHHD